MPDDNWQVIAIWYLNECGLKPTHKNALYGWSLLAPSGEIISFRDNHTVSQGMLFSNVVCLMQYYDVRSIRELVGKTFSYVGNSRSPILNGVGAWDALLARSRR